MKRLRKMYYVTGCACKGGYDYARHAKGENRTLKRINLDWVWISCLYQFGHSCKTFISLWAAITLSDRVLKSHLEIMDFLNLMFERYSNHRIRGLETYLEGVADSELNRLSVSLSRIYPPLTAHQPQLLSQRPKPAAGIEPATLPNCNQFGCSLQFKLHWQKVWSVTPSQKQRFWMFVYLYRSL